MPTYYSLNMHRPELAGDLRTAAQSIDATVAVESAEVSSAIHADLQQIAASLSGKASLVDVTPTDRWSIRQAILRVEKTLGEAHFTPTTQAAITAANKKFSGAIQYVPFWVVLGVALSLGIGTTIGYKRIVVTVAEKIGKARLTYAQGAAAEMIAAATIGLADVFHMPVSTTHVLSSGVAGTMLANRSGVQMNTVKRIGLAWLLTMPAALLLSASLFTLGGMLIPAQVRHWLAWCRSSRTHTASPHLTSV